ncbi:hypothetical protein ST4_057 [Aeromonas phage ST4]|nr:hypothetical protein ST4_057 [Aeromonas phage ST4]
MTDALQATGAISAAAKAKALPWIIIAFLLAMAASGSTGLYFGYQYASNELTAQAATERENLVTAYNKALEEKEARRKEAEGRGRTVESDFLTALQNIQVVNKTYNNEVVKETEKLVYTDCKLPASGVDLLNKHIDAVNAQFLGKAVKP